MSHTIHKLNSNDQRWLDFITGRPDANIFHHPTWLHNLEESYQYHTFIITLEDDNHCIIAGVPMAEVNSRLTGRRWVSLPFSDYCNPLAKNEDALNCLTDGLISFSQEAGIPKMELRWNYPSRPEIKVAQDNTLHVGQFYKATENEAFSQFNNKIRKRIRKTIGQGVKVVLGSSRDHLRHFYDLQSYTRRRHGIPVQPWHYFENLGKNVLEKGMGGVFLAYSDNKCIAGKVFVHFQQTLTMKYAASGNFDCSELYPNYLLDWEVIKWGCEHGYQYYDDGKSACEHKGLRMYKHSWGYQEIPLTYSYLGGAPEKESKLFGMMNFVIRHSPIWVCQVSGELLYRHVG